MKIHIRILICKNSSKENGSVYLSSASRHLWKTLKCIPDIFFNNEMVLVFSSPCFFIRIDKLLTCYHINQVCCCLAICSISKPTGA